MTVATITGSVSDFYLHFTTYLYFLLIIIKLWCYGFSEYRITACTTCNCVHKRVLEIMVSVIWRCGEWHWLESALQSAVKQNNYYTFHITYLLCILNPNRGSPISLDSWGSTVVIKQLFTAYYIAFTITEVETKVI